jgi:hypothetical protein
MSQSFQSRRQRYQPWSLDQGNSTIPVYRVVQPGIMSKGPCRRCNYIGNLRCKVWGKARNAAMIHARQRTCSDEAEMVMLATDMSLSQ